MMKSLLYFVNVVSRYVTLKGLVLWKERSECLGSFVKNKYQWSFRAKGGGFWKAGQEGNLGNYVQDVLNKPAKKSASSNRERVSSLRN